MGVSVFKAAETSQVRVLHCGKASRTVVIHIWTPLLMEVSENGGLRRQALESNGLGGDPGCSTLGQLKRPSVRSGCSTCKREKSLMPTS